MSHSNLLDKFFASRTPSIRADARDKLMCQRRMENYSDMIVEIRRIEKELDLPVARLEKETDMSLLLDELKAIKFHVEPGLLSEWQYFKIKGFVRDASAVKDNFRKQSAIVLLDDNVMFIENVLNRDNFSNR
jgi:hypothetical protein